MIVDQLMMFYRKYPLMRNQDFVKLLYQSEYFGGHFVKSEDDALNMLIKEANDCVTQKVSEENLTDEFLNMARVNLRPFVRENKNLVVLNEIFVKSFDPKLGSRESLLSKLNEFLQLVEAKRIDLPYLDTKKFVNTYVDANFPLQSHSSTYRLNYFPAYRVVNKDFWFLFDVIEKIDQLLTKKLTVTVAIDGNSGSGKSYFADCLKRYFNCSVLHTDDFFLPLELKTESRLKEVGGNVHYERLKPTIIKFKEGEPFEYQRFDCHTQTFSSVKAGVSRLNIVEGCYALHQSVRDMYDLKIVLNANPGVQQQRITARNGKEIFIRFAKEWIPLENVYFENLPKDADTITIDTSKHKIF